MMMEINFYDNIDDSILKFAIIVSRSKEKWVLCKHRERNTLELPGGHREKNETILETAKRELYEETGAIKYQIKPICVYSVIGKDGNIECDRETFGMLYFAEITEFEKELHNEIDKIELVNELPKDNWTYPLMHPTLLKKYLESNN